MKYCLREVDDQRLKGVITEGVLRTLPDWFGIEEAIVEYVLEPQDTRYCRPTWQVGL